MSRLREKIEEITIKWSHMPIMPESYYEETESLIISEVERENKYYDRLVESLKQTTAWVEWIIRKEGVNATYSPDEIRSVANKARSLLDEIERRIP